MNINKAMNFINENNISPDEIFKLVEMVRGLDFSDEQNIRKVVRDVSKMANKPLDKATENRIVREILTNGVNDNLFNLIK